jgi:hypothetical protein
MKKGKDLIALRLRCLLNKDFTFDETVNDLYDDMKYGSTFNIRSFGLGMSIGVAMFIVVMALSNLTK